MPSTSHLNVAVSPLFTRTTLLRFLIVGATAVRQNDNRSVSWRVLICSQSLVVTRQQRHVEMKQSDFPSEFFYLASILISWAQNRLICIDTKYCVQEARPRLINNVRFTTISSQHGTQCTLLCVVRTIYTAAIGLLAWLAVIILGIPI